MFSIWFRPIGTSGALHVEVSSKSDNPKIALSLARHVWDNLSQNFEMVSARP